MEGFYFFKSHLPGEGSFLLHIDQKDFEIDKESFIQKFN